MMCMCVHTEIPLYEVHVSIDVERHVVYLSYDGDALRQGATARESENR